MEHGFDSRRRYNFGINSPAWGTWRFRLAARTHASHAWNTSSILVGATIGNNVAELTEKESGTFFFVNILCLSFLSSSIVRIFVAVILNEKMKKITLSKIMKKVSIMLHPYRKSPNAPTYEDIAEMCGTTPDRVYRIAHGSHIRSFEDSATLTELQRRGIVRS